MTASSLNHRYFIVGGAGFIGSHFTDRLLSRPETQAVTLYDNFSSGREWHYAHHAKDARLKVVRGDVKELDQLKAAMQGHGTVIHLASNPDIARAATDPTIDFWEGTYLTQNVIEAMRVSGAKTILYASGSGVYGDLGDAEAAETGTIRDRNGKVIDRTRSDVEPYYPVSTYGASKLAGEALIGSYAAMFDIKGCAFRFGNVVGPRQTHGVGYDFARRLLANPSELRILGDGSQSKSYIHVEDVVSAVLMAGEKSKRPFDVFNVATGDYITVTEIADIAVECVGLRKNAVHYAYTGGNRGWKGDVPIVRLNTDRIQGLGWRCQRTSRQALQASIQSMLVDIKEGRIPSL